MRVHAQELVATVARALAGKSHTDDELHAALYQLAIDVVSPARLDDHRAESEDAAGERGPAAAPARDVGARDDRARCLTRHHDNHAYPVIQGTPMSEVSTQEEVDQRTQEAWATVPADLERLAEQCCDEYHGEIGTFQDFADDRRRWRDFAKFLWGLGARPQSEGRGR